MTDIKCNCPKNGCPRHGDCGACVEFHRDTMKNIPYCLRALVPQ